tara:strand:+ start:138 stop:596 length:459 start_codon:yes stop_codon:yes gene_type:complete
MNPYAVGFSVGTAVGLTYELDLDEALKRSGIVTGLSYGIQTPIGRSILLNIGGAAWIVVQDSASVIMTAASTRTALGIRAVATTAATYTFAVAAGAIIGAAVGTAVASSIWGTEGKEKAIQFYTGQNTTLLDYVPHYNAYKIIKHYGSELID